MKILKFFQDREDEFISLIKEIVSFTTYSGERESINKFLEYIQNLFAPFEPQISRIDTPAGDILTMDFFQHKQNRIVLLAHADTVKVSDNPTAVIVKNRRLFGNGSFDMKNGICLFYFLMKSFARLGIEPSNQIRIIITPDEESGSRESMVHILRLCRGAIGVLLPEPCCPDGGVKVRRKGVASIKAELTGKASHSGIEPEKGIDANRGLASLIFEIDRIVEAHSDLTFNPGVIKGGSKTNIVSPRSILNGELRSYSNKILKAASKEIEKIDRIGKVGVKIKCEVNHPALEFNDKNRHLYNIAKRCAERIGYDLPACSSGGGSDGSSISAAGIPVLDGLGMKGGGAHAENEYIELSDFPFRAAIITTLCMEL